MNKQTKIDDILMQMISPKLEEIGDRFSKGEGLNNEDINTLLLKSQFNHINHLDKKLDEVTADVSTLKLEFVGLKSEFSSLKYEVKTEISELKVEIGSLKTDLVGLRTDVNILKGDVVIIKADISSLKIGISDLKIDIANIKTDIQTAINKNMQWSIGLIAFIVTALKVIDTVWHR